MPDSLKTACPVHDGRFLQLRADPGKSRDINDGGITRGLPDAAPYIQASENIHIPEEIHRAGTEQPQQLIDDANAQIRHLHEHADHNHG